MSAEEFDNMFITHKLFEMANQIGQGVQDGKIEQGIGVITPFIRPIFAEKKVGVGWTTLISITNPIQCVSCHAHMVWSGVSWSNPTELSVTLDDARAFATNLHAIIDGTQDRAWCGTWPIFVDRIRDEDRWIYSFQRMTLPVHGGAIVSMLKVVDEFIEYIDKNGWNIQENGEEDSGFLEGLG